MILPHHRARLDALAAIRGRAPGFASVDTADDSLLWEVASAAVGRLPGRAEFEAFAANVRDAGLEGAVLRHIAAHQGRDHPDRTVEFIIDGVLVDVHDTARSDRVTGIQRVVRETVRRWVSVHDPVLVAWTDGGSAIRRLDDVERASLLGEPVRVDAASPDDHVLIPVRGRFVAAELTADSWRADAIACLADAAPTRVSAIGYDTVPMTSGDTASAAVAAHFPLYLDALRGADRIVAISESAAAEFCGWRRAVRARDASGGPEIVAVPLATEAAEPTAGDLKRAADLFGEEQTLVLVVGSHEPRKNHLAVLQAARLAWRDGARFVLAFLGGTAWGDDGFGAEAAALGDRVVLVDEVDDGLLAAAYRLATVTLFPSLHEGFGLPVAESLAAGTPVVTSDFGSMREIGEPGGALLVDPRDDRAIAEAIKRVIADPQSVAPRAAAQSGLVVREWGEYAADAWQALTQ